MTPPCPPALSAAAEAAANPPGARGRIRPYRAEDEAAVAGVWYRSGLAAYTYLPTWQSITPEIAGYVIHTIIAAAPNDLYVAEVDGRLAGYMAISASFIDRVYIDPPEWRRGWGRRFVRLAKVLSPGGLELFTHQENHAARGLYAQEGFAAVRFGISPPPESAPDVEYHWRPDGGG